MNCYAWSIPEGCYAYALRKGGGCPSALWFWIAAAIVGGVLVLKK
jgi:hypothetical protein